MSVLLAAPLVYDPPWGRLLLVVHLLLAALTIGAVTHHCWELTLVRSPRLPKLKRYAKWSAIGLLLVWLGGVVIYPSYNVLVRKPPLGWLEANVPWAVGLFEIKEHVGTIALVMLPWLLLSAWRYERLSRVERISYLAATWVFTLFVYYSFIAGGVVTMVKGMP